MCGKPSVYEVRPFCSSLCQSKDLLTWAGEGYKLPGDAPIDGLIQPDDDADQG
ncbi:MAG: DNA gyrase inhibitor YacG [Pseudomonadota bacterium]